MNTEKRYDIVIIGGGISGLSLAYFLAEMDREVLILEASERVGGAIKKLSHEDYAIDLGAHTAYNSYATLLELAEDTTAHTKLQGRAKQKYFFTTPSGLKKLISPLSFPQLFWNLARSFRTPKENKTVQEYYSKIIGKDNYNNFAQHFFKAVLCQQAEDYPAPFFLKRRPSKNKTFPKSFTFEKGMQTVVDTLKNHAKITIQNNVEIQTIKKEQGNFHIETPMGNLTVSDIAFAAYTSEVSKLTKDIAPELSKQLATIPYKAVSSFGVILDKKTTKIRECAGLLTSTNDFTSIVSRDIAPNEKYRGFTIHSQGKIDEAVLEKRICKALNISPEQILKKGYKNSYLPKLHKGHQDFLDTITTLIEATPNLYVTGNYFRGLSLEDCLFRSKSEALHYISNQRN